MTDLRSASVRVPCSTSNLGSGFDTLGLALDRYLRATFTPGDGPLELVRTGSVASLTGPPDDDLLAAMFRRTLEELGSSAHGVLVVDSEIPLARGLGSSAAAIVAGYDLARSVLGLPSDRDEAFRATRRQEGHGDNAAPCLLGGLCAVVPAAEGPRPLPLPLSPDVGFAYAAPAEGISTTEARAALPPQIPRPVAVEQLGRLAALLRGLAEADPELIGIGVQDRLHVPHRLPLIPGAEDAIAAGYAAGAWGVTISGSGSGLLALCEPSRRHDVAAAMHQAFGRIAAGAEGSVALALAPDLCGLERDDR